MLKTKKSWLKAECFVSLSQLDVAQSALLEAHAIGIEVDDGVGPQGEKKYPDNRILLIAYFEPSSDGKEHILHRIKQFFSETSLPMPDLSFIDFEEDDWQGNFVRSCTTFMVEPDIYIVPSFEIDAFSKNPKGDLFIEMDPENAFGTGQHQTTKLCLTLIRQILNDKTTNQLANMRALDVGTGSGILAILMKKLGLAFVVATEIDEDALTTAKKNAQKNGVDLATVVVDDAYVYEPHSYDLVVANILAHVLIEMADNLSQTLNKGGIIILSGIIVDQAQSVVDAFCGQGLSMINKYLMDDWCALVLTRP